MVESIRELCTLSVLFGLAMTAAPEGGVKRVMAILCSVILIVVIISPIAKLDIDSYELAKARYSLREEELCRHGQEMNRQLGRLVIEQQYEAYIMDKAKEMSLVLDGVEVETEWSEEGFWLPYSVQIFISNESNAQSSLNQQIMTELGIPYERQMWTLDDGQEERSGGA